MRAVHPLPIWLHPLGTCKIYDTHADQPAKKRATPYRINVLPLSSQVEETHFQKCMHMQIVFVML